MAKKSGVVFAKDKDGHYKYMNKSEYSRRHWFMNFLTVLFYLLVIAVIVGCGYFIYNDYLKEFFNNWF